MSDQSDTSDDFGRLLREARESRGVSLQELAVATKISLTVLQALERNDMSQVPGGIFSRAFVRTYAEEVGLDPEKTVTSFLDAYPEKGGRDSMRIGEGHISARHAESVVPGGAMWMIIVGVFVFGLVLFLWMRGSEGPPLEPPAETAPAVERVPLQPPPSSRPNPPVAASPTGEAFEGTATDAAALEIMTLEMRLTGDTWVSLTVDGERVLSRILQEGDREVYEARDGLVLNVGDAGVFDFSINQQPGRSLGESGETVTVEIDRDNYLGFVTP